MQADKSMKEEDRVRDRLVPVGYMSEMVFAYMGRRISSLNEREFNRYTRISAAVDKHNDPTKDLDLLLVRFDSSVLNEYTKQVVVPGTSTSMPGFEETMLDEVISTTLNNSRVYDLCMLLVPDKISRSSKPSDVRGDLTLSSFMCASRSTSRFSDMMNLPEDNVLEECATLISNVEAIISAIDSASKDCSTRSVESGVSSTGVSGLGTYRSDSLRVVVAGDLVYLEFGKNSMLTCRLHISRLEAMCRGVANQCIISRSYMNDLMPSTLISIVAEAYSMVGKEDADEVPGAFKSARQIFIYKLEATSVVEYNQIKEYKGTLSEKKLLITNVIVGRITSLVREPCARVTLSNIYLVLPHPDVPMSEMFSTILGVHEPNKTKTSSMRAFEVELRKQIFDSLRSQGIKSKLRVAETAHASAAHLAMLSCDQSKGHHACLEHSALDWYATKFTVCPELIPPSQMKLRPQAKSSGPSVVMAQGDSLKISKSQLKGGDRTYRNSVDIVEYDAGNKTFSVSKAIARFKKVIKLHENFEATHGGASRVTYSELSKFVLSNPEAAYTVSTEPKFGEKHKRITRCFYLAETDLKLITQTAERLAKQISRKQAGVSIVQTARQRASDMESLCSSYRHAIQNEGRVPVYVSFDMAEFSKKFPRSLLAIYGKIMSELTGDDHLKRIDLVFRSSVVISSSRGHAGIVSGALGGFEGFLNFIWTSLHAVVMKVALDKLGTSGFLMTYSDDGILTLQFDYINLLKKSGYTQDKARAAYHSFIMGEDKGSDSVKILRKDVTRVLKSIEETYGEYGLHFKLAKMFVSSDVWEYLGVNGVKGKIIPYFTKEVSKLGSSDSTDTLITVADRIGVVSSQAQSAVMRGLDPCLGSFLAHYHTIRLIKKLFPGIDKDLLPALLILPHSMGGFNVLSPESMCSFDSTPQIERLLVDLNRLNKANGKCFEGVSSVLLNLVKRDSNAGACLAKAIPINTPGASIAGLSVLEAVYTEVIMKSGGNPNIKHPLDGKLGIALKAIAKNSPKVVPGYLSDLVLSTPTWTAYSEILAATKNAGLIKELGGRRLAYYRRKCLNSASDLYRSMSESLSKSFRLVRSPSHLLTQLVRISYPSVKFYEIRPPLRCCMTIVTSLPKSGYCVNMRGLERDAKLLTGVDEPRTFLGSGMTRLKWFGEASGGNTDQNMTAFIDSAARLLAYEPTLVTIVQAIMDAEGVNVTIPAALFSSQFGKSRKNRDFIELIPTQYRDLLNVTPVGDLQRELYKVGGGLYDRTTHVQQARAVAFTAISMAKGLYSNRASKNFYISLSIDHERLLVELPIGPSEECLPVYHSSPPMRGLTLSNPQLQSLTYDAVLSHVQTLSAEDRLIKAFEGMATPEDVEVGISLMARQLAKSLNLSRNSMRYGSIVAPSITYHTRVIARACAMHALDNMTPGNRRVLVDFVNSVRMRARYITDPVSRIILTGKASAEVHKLFKAVNGTSEISIEECLTAIIELNSLGLKEEELLLYYRFTSGLYIYASYRMEDGVNLYLTENMEIAMRHILSVYPPNDRRFGATKSFNDEWDLGRHSTQICLDDYLEPDFASMNDYPDLSIASDAYGYEPEELYDLGTILSLETLDREPIHDILKLKANYIKLLESGRMAYLTAVPRISSDNRLYRLAKALLSNGFDVSTLGEIETKISDWFGLYNLCQSIHEELGDIPNMPVYSSILASISYSKKARRGESVNRALEEAFILASEGMSRCLEAYSKVVRTHSIYAEANSILRSEIQGLAATYGHTASELTYTIDYTASTASELGVSVKTQIRHHLTGVLSELSRGKYSDPPSDSDRIREEIMTVLKIIRESTLPSEHRSLLIPANLRVVAMRLMRVILMFRELPPETPSPRVNDYTPPDLFGFLRKSEGTHDPVTSKSLEKPTQLEKGIWEVLSKRYNGVSDTIFSEVVTADGRVGDIYGFICKRVGGILGMITRSIRVIRENIYTPDSPEMYTAKESKEVLMSVIAHDASAYKSSGMYVPLEVPGDVQDEFRRFYRQCLNCIYPALAGKTKYKCRSLATNLPQIIDIMHGRSEDGIDIGDVNEDGNDLTVSLHCVKGENALVRYLSSCSTSRLHDWLAINVSGTIYVTAVWLGGQIPVHIQDARSEVASAEGLITVLGVYSPGAKGALSYLNNYLTVDEIWHRRNNAGRKPTMADARPLLMSSNLFHMSTAETLGYTATSDPYMLAASYLAASGNDCTISLLLYSVLTYLLFQGSSKREDDSIYDEGEFIKVVYDETACALSRGDSYGGCSTSELINDIWKVYQYFRTRKLRAEDSEKGRKAEERAVRLITGIPTLSPASFDLVITTTTVAKLVEELPEVNLTVDENESITGLGTLWKLFWEPAQVRMITDNTTPKARWNKRC